MIDNLPQGWDCGSFMEIFDIQGGTQPPKKEFIYQETEGYIRLLQIRDFGSKPVPTYVPIKNTLKICEQDDILIGRYGASVGRICTGMKGAYNVALAKVNIPSRLYKKFVYFLLQSETFQSCVLSTERSAQDGFNKEDLANIIISLPPVNEQHRIVAKLEKLLAKVDACKQRLDKIPTILNRFRQSVLAAACSGRLTADWREQNSDIESAEELILSLQTPYPETHLDIFKDSSINEIPNSWIWIPLGKLGKLTGGGTPSKSNPDYWNGDIPWISAKDMKCDRVYDSIDHITEEAIEKSSTRKIDRGSILFVVRGMILRHTFPVAITDRIITVNQDIKTLIPEKPEMSEYLFVAVKSIAQNILFSTKEATHGTKRIETPILQNWAIPIPPLEEQQEIVHQVEKLFKKADAIEQRYQKAKEYVDKLTQSILAKAFRGELVPQDPNDEPASVLLERIREERAKQETKTKATKKKKTKTTRNKTPKKKPETISEPQQLDIPGLD